MSKEIDDKIEELRKIAKDSNVNALEFLNRAKIQLLNEEKVNKTQEKSQVSEDGTQKTKEQTKEQTKEEIKQKEYQSAWARVMLARHSDRPTALQYIDKMSEQYMEFHGDRCTGDDNALVGGLCTISGIHFTFVANQKGSNMKENIKRNYGMGHPEGYRKALRLMKQAAKFRRPIITLIDTSGAYPGLASEERGIGEAIAKNLMELSVLETLIICIIIGEGGSGGALGIGIGDKVFMLENSVYSVISPEGFASILLRDPKRTQEAAALMKMTAKDILNFGFIDGIIPESEGGAHNDTDFTANNIKDVILHTYFQLKNKDVQQLVQERSKRIISWTRNFGEKTDTKKSLLSKFKNFFIE